MIPLISVCVVIVVATLSVVKKDFTVACFEPERVEDAEDGFSKKPYKHTVLKALKNAKYKIYCYAWQNKLFKSKISAVKSHKVNVFSLTNAS